MLEKNVVFRKQNGILLGHFMKYKIDNELKKIAKLKIPKSIKIFPIMNMFVGLSRCRSDNKVRVISYKTPGYNGTKLKTLVIEPKCYEGKLPCIVFFHGGGFMLKASFAHYKLAKLYAEKLPCKVVYTDYRLSPKYHFPIPAEDCFQTYKWVLDNTDMLNIDPNRIIVAGDSAGGNLALAVTLMARDKGMRIPNAELLIYPVTDRRMITESMKKYVDAPIWNANLTKIMWKAYLGNKTPEKIEYASPIEAESFEGFPPTYIEVAQYDALRDEGICLYDKLYKQNIECEMHEIMGACHGFETALKSNMLRECMNRRIDWLKNIINR